MIGPLLGAAADRFGQRRVLLAMEGAFDDVSVEKAEKAGYANTEE